MKYDTWEAADYKLAESFYEYMRGDGGGRDGEWLVKRIRTIFEDLGYGFELDPRFEEMLDVIRTIKPFDWDMHYPDVPSSFCR